MQTPKFLNKELVLAIHADQIETYGGTPGVRDEGLLDSALAQPPITMFGQLLHPTLMDQAAAYLFHIALNHAFQDGNKRTAIACTETFLLMNGCVLECDDDFLFSLTLDVINKMVEKEAIAETLKSVVADISTKS